MAVQALAVMTIFAQGISSPAKLEYSLSSSASRLALSLGLNICTPSDWNITEGEKGERSRVFWIVYCLDKTIALRCGRPPVIQDEDVSCYFLRHVLPMARGEQLINVSGTMNNNGQFEFLLHFARYSQICGKIYRQLYSATALSAPLSHLETTRNQLLEELEMWLQALPGEMQPGKPLTNLADGKSSLRTQAVVLHLSYFYSLCSIYRRFTVLFDKDGEEMAQMPQLATQPSHVEAARSMILLTKYISVESFSPNW